MSSCTYKFKNASGEEVTITGQAEMKAFLANGGLEQLLPGKVLPWKQAETSKQTQQSTLEGPRREPTKVSMFNPYQDGDVVTIGGQDWQVKQDMPGWYLTSTGNWRGTHPKIQRIRGMADLIREVEQAYQEAVPAPEQPAPQPAKAEEKPAKQSPAEASDKPFALSDLDALQSSLQDGSATVDQYQSAWQAFKQNQDAIKAELTKKTKPQLLDMVGGMLAYRLKGDNKPEIIKAVFEAARNIFSLSREYGPASYFMGEYQKYQEAKDKAFAEMVEATTAEDLKAYADKVAEADAERKKALDEFEKAIEDPQTLDDFRKYVTAKLRQGMSESEVRMSLTPEQRARMDELHAEYARNSRTSRPAPAVTAAAVTTGGDIVATKHTQTGEDLYVVRPAERVERDQYNIWNATAKRLGGWYSKYRGNGAVPGFQFKTRESADAFLAYIGGDTEGAKQVAQERRDAFADDRSQSAVERLTEMADRLEDRADESLSRDRKANTARRASMAASAEASANADKAMARTMRNIANAIKDGKAKFLDKVRQKVQVELLASFVRDAKHAELTERYPSYADFERNRYEKPTAETADYAVFPKYTANRSDLARMGREMELIEGAKQMGQRILKAADDATDEYLKFVKENLHKVSTFTTSDGKPAIYSSRDDAERAIARSGYRGKAMVFSVKRGQNLVVMGPSMAQEKGLWKADGDKRITLTDESGEELTSKAEALNKSREKVHLPYQFSTTRERRAKLKAMGIETPAEFRAALREFIALSEAPEQPNRVKELERSMVGRRNDGLDFFPTPAGIAQQMIEAADLKEGMSVLEPSAGMGHIAEQIREAGVDPDVVEFSGDRRELLEAKGFNVVANDFMEASGEYDRIIMNPPFSDRRDAQHVRHAYNLLKPGGRLVAIMGEGVFFGQDKRAAEFREWLESVGGTSEKLPDGSFLDPSLPVNTGVNARMVVIEKAADAQPATDSPDPEQGIALYEIDENGDPSPKEAEAVQRGLEGKNPIEAAAWLAENAPPEYAAVAEKVRDKLQELSSRGVNFGLSIIQPGAMGEAELSGARGATVPVRDGDRVALRIVLNGAGMTGRVGTSYRTALHELAHAATMQSVQLGNQGLPQYAQAVRDLVDVANAIHSHMQNRAKANPDALTDFERAALSGRSNFFQSIDEVLVWGMTSPDARAYLESIPYKSKSLWTAFVAAVRKALGLSEKSDTALSEILRVSEVLMRPIDTGAVSGFARFDPRYEVQQPHGGRVFLNPGGVPDAVWTGEAIDEGAARARERLAVLRDADSTQDTAPSVPREQAEDFIRRFVAEYPGAPQIMLADSFYQLPEDIQADALAQGSGPTRAKGALKNGKAYVVLNTHTSMADLEASVFHEVLGHAGIRKLLGPAFAQELNKMFIGLGGYSKLYQIMSRRGMGRQFEGYYDAVQRAREKNPEVWTEFLASSILTEEVFAHIAEQKNAKALRDRFMALVGMVRDWLRRNGFAKLASLGESDIVFLLQRARAGMKDGSGVMRDGVTVGEKAIVDSAGRTVAKEGSPDYEMLKVISERLGMRETNGPTVFSNSLPEEGKPGDDARMDDANNVAGKQAPTPAGDVEAGGAASNKLSPGSRVADKWGDKYTIVGPDPKNALRVIAHQDGYSTPISMPLDNIAGGAGKKADADNGEKLRLYHGSPENNLSEIRDDGKFRGLFMSPSKQNATGLTSTEQYLHTSDVDRKFVATHSDLNNLSARKRAVARNVVVDLISRKATQKEVNTVLDAALKDKEFVSDLSDDEKEVVIRVTGALGDGDASWEVQMIRGQIAKKLGYKAVAMHDEQGTSYLVLPGTEVKPLNEPSASASSDAPAVFRTASPEQLREYAQPRGTVAREAFNSVVSAFKQPTAKVFGLLHKTIATQLHKAWVSKDYAKVFGLADAYERDISRFGADPATAAPNLLPSFDSLAAAAGRVIHGNKNAKLMDGVAEAIFSGTLAGEDVTSGRKWTDAELRNQFGLNEQQIGLYKEARAAIDASLDAAASGLAWQMVKNYIPTMKESVRAETGNAETIIDGAMRQLEEELREIARYQQAAEQEGVAPEGAAAKTIKKAQDVAEARQAAEGVFLRADALKEAGYAPLMRFGKYAVDVVETLPDGTQERLGFYKFETEVEAKMAADRMKKAHPEAEVTRSVMSEEAWKLYRGVDPELVSMFADKIDGLEGLNVENEVLQEWYRSAVNDRSAFKRMIQRKGVEGFERDITRVVASFITSNARVAARQFNMGDLSKEIADMQARKVSGDVVDEAVQLKEYMENPTEPFQGLKGWMFAWFLGGSVASAALNMTQPLMMTLPYLSQFGAGKAAASLAGASKEAMSGKVSDPELSRALSRAAKDGKVDPQQVHHLYHEGMSSFLSKLPLGAGARERAQGFMTLWGYMFGAVENFNRRITFIAAYRMAKNDESLGNPYDFAVKAIDETQGIYNKANRPNWARGTGPFGAIGVAAFTFKQYSIGYIELLVRMAKSGKNGKLGAAAMLGLLVMLSGMQGMPGADDVEDIIDTVAQHLGYTGNSKLAIRNKLRELLGEEVGNVAMNGVLSLLPFDIGSRVGLGNLLPASAIAKPSEQNRGAQLAELFGPPLSMANQVIDASLAVESGGGVLGVAKVMAPVAFKNLMAAYDMADSGVYRDTRGRKVTDVSLADAMFKAGGFQPMSVSKEQKGARLIEMTGQRIRMVKSAINGMKARAIVENDNDLRQRAEAMRMDWNRKNPEATIMPDAPAVMRRVKEMNTERRARLMKSLPKEYRRVAEGEMN